MVKGASLPFLSRRTDLSTMSYAEPSIGNSGAFGLLLRVTRSFKAAGDNGTSKSLLPFVRDPGAWHTAPSVSDHVAGVLELVAGQVADANRSQDHERQCFGARTGHIERGIERGQL